MNKDLPLLVIVGRFRLMSRFVGADAGQIWTDPFAFFTAFRSSLRHGGSVLRVNFVLQQAKWNDTVSTHNLNASLSQK